MANWNPEIDLLLTDSEDEEEFKRDFKGREAMIFVIDAFLFKTKDRFYDALNVIKGAFINAMLINDKDLMGIVFANTEMSPEPLESSCLDNIVVPDKCAVFLPPRQLTEPIVSYFLNFLTTADNVFTEQYGTADNDACANFSSVLRLCVNLFDSCSYSLNYSRIIYMTDKETPHSPKSYEYQNALQKATDLEGREIEFYVIPMVNEFNYDIFYKEFLALVRDVDLDGVVLQKPEELRELLSDYKLKKDFEKRCLGHFNFSLGANLDISVEYFNYYQNRMYPRSIKLLRKNNSIVTQKRVIKVQTQDKETLEYTEESQIKQSEGWYELNLGSENIRITPLQINRVRNLHAPGMKLLGFKPKSSLPKNVYYKPCNFMYPDDQAIIGSRRLFRALWQRCLEREKIAICIFMRKRKSIPRYVALVPVTATINAETDDVDYERISKSDGFKIVYLPLADNIRYNDLSEWNCIENTATDDSVELFQKIIKKLRIKYEANCIADPTLETLQANLLGLALNIRTENKDSNGVANVDAQNKRIENFLPKLQEIFGDEHEPTKKRPAKSSDERSAKVAKSSNEDIENYSYVENMIKKKTVDGCTVAQLRTILEIHFNTKVSKNLKKADLVNQIYETYC